MQDWTKYDKHEIYSDKKNGGLLVSFLTEYKKEFNVKVINVNCPSCFNSYWKTYINSLPMAKTKQPEVQCDYKLKQKFNGIQIGTNGRPIRNGEMTNEIAETLLSEHPHGANLFDVIPAIKISRKEEEKKNQKIIDDTLKKKEVSQKKSEKDTLKATTKAISKKSTIQKATEEATSKQVSKSFEKKMIAQKKSEEATKEIKKTKKPSSTTKKTSNK